jgi:hypothetical protein
VGSAQGAEEHAAFVAETVVLCAANFVQNAVGAQQPQEPAYARTAPALFHEIACIFTKEQSAHVAVAHSLDGKFAAADDRKQSLIFAAPGAQAPVAASVADEGAADWLSQFAQGPSRFDAGQRLEVTLVGRCADLRTPVQIGYPRYAAGGCAALRPRKRLPGCDRP